jgi:16S rRNA (uracil1498-N3)-methyltransferase
MSERFFVESPIRGSEAQLMAGEAQHVAKVLRARPGDGIVVFDGSGAEFLAQLISLGRHEVNLQIVVRREVSRELLREITLAVALPKGDRQQWLVEKLTELGVARLVPLRTERNVAQPVEKALGRLRRWVIEASKQCGRNTLLEIAPPADFLDYVSTAPLDAQRVIAHPGANQSLELASMNANFPLVAVIGPEGGWTEDEVAQARTAGWQAVDLGPTILRIEKAAVKLAILAQR